MREDRKEKDMRTMVRRKTLWQVVVVAVAGILWTWGMVGPDYASAVADACKLLTAGEIEAVVREKLNMAPLDLSADPKTGKPSICQLKGGSYSVLVRFAKRTADSGNKEKKGIEEAKKMGIKVTVDKQGNTTCSTAIGSSQMIYNTTCTVIKGGDVVGVEVNAPSEAKMVPVSKVRPLAEKAASRL